MAIMQNTKRVWRTSCEFAGKADAELVQNEIELIAANDIDNKCKCDDMVAYAANNISSELYKCFEWDDKTAGHKYRLQQASRIKDCIRTIIVTQDTDSELSKDNTSTTTTSIELVTNYSLPTPGTGHESINMIMQDKDKQAALKQEMYSYIKRFIHNFHTRYQYCSPEFEQFMDEFNKIKKLIP